MLYFWKIVFALIFSTTAYANDLRNEHRENLVRLSVAPTELGGQTVRVFCPIETADTDIVTCLVLNSFGRLIGRELILVEPRNARTYIDILDRCANPIGTPVGDDCAYLVDVFVDVSGGYASPKAVNFEPILP